MSWCIFESSTLKPINICFHLHFGFYGRKQIRGNHFFHCVLVCVPEFSSFALHNNIFRLSYSFYFSFAFGFDGIRIACVVTIKTTVFAHRMRKEKRTKRSLNKPERPNGEHLRTSYTHAQIILNKMCKQTRAHNGIITRPVAQHAVSMQFDF